MRNLIQLSNDLNNFSPEGICLDSVLVEENCLRADIIVSVGGVHKSWKLEALGQKKVSNNLFIQNFVPFFTVKILEDHPLLWELNSDCIYLEIEDYFDSPSEFQNALKDQIYMSSKGWVDFYSVFGGSLWRKRQELLKKKNSKNLDACVPEKLFSVVSKICAAYNIRILNKGMEENQNSSKSSLLLFTNDFLAKDDFKANQPYIIAETISITKGN